MVQVNYDDDYEIYDYEFSREDIKYLIRLAKKKGAPLRYKEEKLHNFFDSDKFNDMLNVALNHLNLSLDNSQDVESLCEVYKQIIDTADEFNKFSAANKEFINEIYYRVSGSLHNLTENKKDAERNNMTSFAICRLSRVIQLKPSNELKAIADLLHLSNNDLIDDDIDEKISNLDKKYVDKFNKKFSTNIYDTDELSVYVLNKIESDAHEQLEYMIGKLLQIEQVVNVTPEEANDSFSPLVNNIVIDLNTNNNLDSLKFKINNIIDSFDIKKNKLINPDAID